MALIDQFRRALPQRSFRSARKVGAALAVAAASLLAITTSDARPHRGHRSIHGANYHPPYSAVVIDDNSGQVLHEVDADGPRHPASLTKVMTLYILFGEIEAGRFKLDMPLEVSAQAAAQAPTRLGLKAGQKILVEDAIKGMVTRSANDAAVVIAEAVAGSEEEFAKLMTHKARALGMVNTVYVNASGLPADQQWTTARDQALLGRAVQHRFPIYYGYFALPSFAYRGRAMSNHNSLLRTVEGVDGIKTGYTEASGYNLVSSVRRGERRIVGVVLGGTSNGSRDARMRELIEQCISQAATRRTAAMITEAEDGSAVYVPASLPKPVASPATSPKFEAVP